MGRPMVACQIAERTFNAASSGREGASENMRVKSMYKWSPQTRSKNQVSNQSSQRVMSEAQHLKIRPCPLPPLKGPEETVKVMEMRVERALLSTLAGVLHRLSMD